MIDRKNILNLAIRHRIYDYVIKNAGLHITKLSHNLKIPRTTLKHHLRYLEDCGLVIEKREGHFLRFYAVEKVGMAEKKILNLLRQKIPCNIVLILYFYLAASRIQISKTLEIKPTTIDFHLKKLLDAGIIEPAPVRKDGVYFYKNKILKFKPTTKEFLYRLKDVNAIDKVLIAHRDSFKDVQIIQLVLGPLSYCYNESLPTINYNEKDAVDKIVEKFYDIFPPPIIL